MKSKIQQIDYERINAGKRLDTFNRPYSTQYMIKLIEYFENLEEYEKCYQLVLAIKKIEKHQSGYAAKNNLL